MTHPPATRKRITPIDPDSPQGRSAAEVWGQVLAEIQVAVWQRRAARQQLGKSPKPTPDPSRQPTPSHPPRAPKPPAGPYTQPPPAGPRRADGVSA